MMTDGRRANDGVLFEAIGRLTALSEQAAKDRADMWHKINDIHTVTLTRMGAIPVIEETLSDHDDRLDELEKAEKKRAKQTAKVVGVVSGFSLAAGFFAAHTPPWLADLLKIGGK